MSIDNVDDFSDQSDDEVDLSQGTETEQSDELEPTDTDDGAEEQSEAESEDQEGEAESKPKGKGASARIQQLNQEKKQAQAELEALRKQLEGKETPEPKSTELKAPTKPKFEDYDDDKVEQYFKDLEKYEEDVLEYKFEKRAADQAQKQAESAKQAQYQERGKAVVDSIQQQFKADPELQAVFKAGIERESDHPLPFDLVELGLDPNQTADLALEIARNEDLHYELSAMTPQQAFLRVGRAIGEMEARKSSDSVAPRVSKAPKPPNHTKSSTPSKRDPHKMSDDDFAAMRGI